jgi:hypothetical protein
MHTETYHNEIAGKATKRGKDSGKERQYGSSDKNANLHQDRHHREIPNLSKTFPMLLAFCMRYAQIPLDFEKCIKRFVPMVKNIDRFHSSQNLVTHHMEIWLSKFDESSRPYVLDRQRN